MKKTSRTKATKKTRRKQDVTLNNMLSQITKKNIHHEHDSGQTVGISDLKKENHNNLVMYDFALTLARNGTITHKRRTKAIPTTSILAYLSYTVELEKGFTVRISYHILKIPDHIS